jgi:hypothetical protein
VKKGILGWVRAGPFTPEVVVRNPEAIRQLHIEFREAGAEVLQALTFYASRDTLATVGLENQLEELNPGRRFPRDTSSSALGMFGEITLISTLISRARVRRSSNLT